VVSNVQVSQSGKYYVLVSSAANCTHLDSVIAAVNPAPVATSSVDEVTLCEGKSVQLTGGGGGTYLWSPSIGLSASSIDNPVASPSDTTVYSLVVTNGFNCTDTAFSTINVIKSPTVDAGTNKSIIKGNSVLLTATATGQNVDYTWTPSVFIDNIHILQPTVNPPRDTVYVLTATSRDGCGSATDSVHVLVFKDIFVPTAFSPDGNGLNDTWSIPALAAYPEYEISVFNRYGNLIFFRKNNNQPWDGTIKGVKAPSGIYVYMIKVKQGNMIKGTLALIR
jgi:gliding motility-associated-like protein